MRGNRENYPFKIGDVIRWKGYGETIGIILKENGTFLDSWHLVVIDSYGNIDKKSYNCCSCVNIQYATNEEKEFFLKQLKKLDPFILDELYDKPKYVIKFFK